MIMRRISINNTVTTVDSYIMRSPAVIMRRISINNTVTTADSYIKRSAAVDKEKDQY